MQRSIERQKDDKKTMVESVLQNGVCSLLDEGYPGGRLAANGGGQGGSRRKLQVYFGLHFEMHGCTITIQMSRITSLPLLLAGLTFLLACVNPIHRGYEGDGEFTDKGFYSGTRYSLDLGEVDFSKKMRRTYRIGPLPKEIMVVGFDGVQTRFTSEKPKILLHLRDTTENATIFQIEENIFDREGKSDGWNYSGERGNQPYSVPKYVAFDLVPESSRKLGHVGGSQFIPKRWHSYQLDFEILDPVSTSEKCRLKLEGGGFKARNPSEYK